MGEDNDFFAFLNAYVNTFYLNDEGKENVINEIKNIFDDTKNNILNIIDIYRFELDTKENRKEILYKIKSLPSIKQ